MGGAVNRSPSRAQPHESSVSTAHITAIITWGALLGRVHQVSTARGRRWPGQGVTRRRRPAYGRQTFPTRSQCTPPTAQGQTGVWRLGGAWGVGCWPDQWSTGSSQSRGHLGLELADRRTGKVENARKGGWEAAPALSSARKEAAGGLGPWALLQLCLSGPGSPPSLQGGCAAVTQPRPAGRRAFFPTCSQSPSDCWDRSGWAPASRWGVPGPGCDGCRPHFSPWGALHPPTHSGVDQVSQGVPRCTLGPPRGPGVSPVPGSRAGGSSAHWPVRRFIHRIM